jgi:hypothetical protein
MTRYCPQCRGEYQDWVQKCRDCGVELVDILPEPEIGPEPEPRYLSDDSSMYTTEPLVVIAEYADMMDAKLAKEILESEGITAFVPDRESVNLSWSGLLPHIEAKLIVREIDAERALEILTRREMFPKDEPEDIEPEDGGIFS